ncbi:MAG: hypothetical protein JHD02_01400 [Thermoleophilaceae bacterium]|nr:hypothetical protein [Thermoleophilaceae bacterium]
MDFEKPDGPEDWLAAISVALLITAIISLPVVGGVMWLWIGTPTWSLAVAVALILAFSIVLVFSPAPEDEDEELDNLRWKRVDRPKDFVGWARLIGGMLLVWLGLGWFVNGLVLGVILDAGDTAKGIAAIIMLPLAVVVDGFDLVDTGAGKEVVRENPSSSAVKYHSIER